MCTNISVYTYCILYMSYIILYMAVDLNSFICKQLFSTIKNNISWHIIFKLLRGIVQYGCYSMIARNGDPGLPFSARKKRKRVHRSTWHPVDDRCTWANGGRVDRLLVVEYPIISLYLICLSDVDHILWWKYQYQIIVSYSRLVMAYEWTET